VCFSAEVDVAAGIVVGVVGVDALGHVRRPAERALTAIPVVLAAHLPFEAFVSALGVSTALMYAVARGVVEASTEATTSRMPPASSRRALSA
jgi:hypothetical protein